MAGFNAPNRVVLTRDARPDETFEIAVFGIIGPFSASPRNYIWLRTAVLDFYAAEAAAVTEQAAYYVERADAALDRLLTPGTPLERVAAGFEFTEGPVWTRDGALRFSAPTPTRSTGSPARAGSPSSGTTPATPVSTSAATTSPAATA